ncbi:MAG: 30S ribosomal protein S7 [Candidatus Omnitrophica bacterium]|nr:30S ribosomal protein S7 [Candidatus Omnitrophota bacterium]
MRRRRANRREIIPDPRYGSKLISKFVNAIMLKGKKAKAERIVYSAFGIVQERTGKDSPLEILQKAVDNVRPRVEVKSRRVGGATYQVPIEVRPDRSVSLALRWIRDFARGRKGKPMEERLADELLDAFNGTGTAVKKKDDTHRMAEANKAFAHYRW